MRVACCVIPNCRARAAGRRGLFCPEHLLFLPMEYQQRLEVLGKAWRPGSIQRAIGGGVPPPLAWEVAAVPRALGQGSPVPQHPFTRWKVAAVASTALVLTLLWEGVFPLPPSGHSFTRACACALCSLAWRVAPGAVDRRGYVHTRHVPTHQAA